MTAFQIIACIMLSFTALGFACAVRIGRRRDTLADPHALPFGDHPYLYSREQLVAIARRPIIYSDPSSGGAFRPDADARRFEIPSGPAGVRAGGRDV